MDSSIDKENCDDDDLGTKEGSAKIRYEDSRDSDHVTEDDDDKEASHKSTNNNQDNKIINESKSNNNEEINDPCTDISESERSDIRNTVGESAPSEPVIPCSHCTKNFPNRNALTRHLYKILGVKVNDEPDSDDEAAIKADSVNKVPETGGSTNEEAIDETDKGIEAARNESPDENVEANKTGIKNAETVQTLFPESEAMVTETIRIGNTEHMETVSIKTEIMETERIKTEIIETDTIKTEIIEILDTESPTIKTEAIETQAIKTERIETETEEEKTIKSENTDAEAMETQTIKTEITETETENETVEEETIQAENIVAATIITETILDKALAPDNENKAVSIDFYRTEIIKAMEQEILEANIMDRDMIKPDPVESEILEAAVDVAGTIVKEITKINAVKVKTKANTAKGKKAKTKPNNKKSKTKTNTVTKTTETKITEETGEAVTTESDIVGANKELETAQTNAEPETTQTSKTIDTACLEDNVQSAEPANETSNDDGESDEAVLSEEMENTMYKCPECTCIFIKDCNLEKHLKYNHNIVGADLNSFTVCEDDDEIECPFCPTNTADYVYNNHIKRKHYNFFMKAKQGGTGYQCSQCYEIFYRYAAAMYHKHPEMPRKPELWKFPRNYNDKNTETETSPANDEQTKTKTKKAKHVDEEVINEEVINEETLSHELNTSLIDTELNINEETVDLPKELPEDLPEDLPKDLQNEPSTSHNAEKINNETENVDDNSASDNPKGKIKLWYCEICECCYTDRKHNEIKGDCKKATKEVCPDCGLNFTANALRKHRTAHIYKKNNLYQFIIFDINNSLPVIPKQPKYPKCSRCKRHYISKMELNLHDCGWLRGKSKTCPECHLKYSLEAYRLHKKFHRYVKIIRENEIVQSDNNEIEDKQESEVVKTQLTLNILYMCYECNIFMDRYDLAVDHSHRHLSSETLSRKHIKKCQKCNLDFELKSYNNHKKLHESNDDINRNSFRIIQFDYKDLNKGDWLKSLTESSDDCIDDTISHSIYNAMQVHIEVLRDCGQIFYKCTKCETYFVNDKLVSCHLYNGKCYSEKPRENPTELFTNHNLVDEDNKKYTSDDNQAENLSTNETAIISEENINLSPINEVKTKLTARNVPALKVFKCKCGLHFPTQVAIEKHIVSCPNKEIQASHCRQCNLLFPTNILVSHVIKHHQKNKRKVIIEDFQPKMRKVNLYECSKCSLLFPNKTDALDHNDCGSNNGENCNYCNLIFHTDSFNAHQCTDYVENDIITIKDIDKLVEPGTSGTSNTNKTIYKCAICNIHFITLETWFKHTEEGHKWSSTAPCDLCNLNFTIKDMYEHKKIHHNDTNKGKYLNVKVVESDAIKEFQVLRVRENDEPTPAKKAKYK